ncbi:MAG TPA: penicillin acylase family protein [Solirubrobacteraceae bacterium]|nr:penicillin acylase family protein [Solirubrobacteraceae bacterium]
MWRAVLGAVAVGAAVLPGSAAGQGPLPPPGGGGGANPPALSVPRLGHFRSVLAQGEGQTITASDLAAFEAFGTVPGSFVNQQPLYVGVMPHAASLSPADLNTYYKTTDFGSLPGGVASVETPRSGVQIFRDKSFGMAHIYGATRDDVMWAAGYAQAEERLFLMDAVRHTAEGNLAGLLGPSAASGDAQQLTDQDFSPQELTAQFNALPQKFGAEGARAQQDLNDFVAGINARIDEDKLNPTEMPAEYAALGTQPAHWTVADSAAEAVLLVTQFTVSNGDEQVNAMLEQEFQKRFGSSWAAPYHDLRQAQDPQAFTVAKRPFQSDNPGPVQPGLNAIPDYGSLKRRNAEIAGPDAGKMAAARAALPAWARSLEGLRQSLPHVESNAVMVSGRLSSDGRPLAAMGPQVGYYSPQIFSEYELHGGGIDGEGVTFPGASPYPLIGHGIDFAWTGTSANGDNEDTFVERLCNPDGSPPTAASTHYLYHGACQPFLMRDQSVTTPASPVSPSSPPQTITYRTMRSVHGPVFEFATVNGAPVALTKAKAVDFHELDAVIPFMRLAENQPTDARSFMTTMGTFPGTENWFYVDNRNVGWQQSGRYQLHARGSNVDLPFWGDGSADWQGFDPATYTAQYLPDDHRPAALDPPDGFIISWNNKEAPGWRKGPADWSGGPIDHALVLQQRLLDQVHAHGGTVDLTGLTRSVNTSATTDLREKEDYPLMRQVIGTASGQDEQMLKLLDDWYQSGSQRLAPAGGNVYGHSAAVALLDAWWPRAVTAEFQGALGGGLFKAMLGSVLSLPSDRFGGYDWTSDVYKDLRDVLAPNATRPRHTARRHRARRTAGHGRHRHRAHRHPARRRAAHRTAGHRHRHRRSHGQSMAPATSALPSGWSRVYCGGGPQASGSLTACRAQLLAALEQAIAAVKAKLGPDPSQWKVYATCPKTDPPSCDQEVPVTGGAVDTPPFPWQDRGTYHQVDELTGRR